MAFTQLPSLQLLSQADLGLLVQSRTAVDQGAITQALPRSLETGYIGRPTSTKPVKACSAGRI